MQITVTDEMLAAVKLVKESADRVAFYATHESIPLSREFRSAMQLWEGRNLGLANLVIAAIEAEEKKTC